jgi:tRNA nucleotidyltransferase (CCA-adding enzyme)
MGALFHDVGKPASAEEAYGPGQFSFHDHDEIGSEITRTIVDRLRFSNDDKNRIVGMVRHHMALFGYGDETTPKALRRIIRKLGNRMPDIVTLSMADIIGKGIDEDPEERLPRVRERLWEAMGEIASGGAVKTNQLAINGKDVMKELGIDPGAQVGVILRALLERVMDDPNLNNREALIRLIPQVPC